MKCVFCQIRDKEIAKEFLFEDKDVMVFPDLNPAKPIHILVVPKVHIEDYLQFNNSDLLFKIKKVINKVIESQNLTDKGYRVSVNGGGAQIINHLHFHIIGPMGKNMEN